MAHEKLGVFRESKKDSELVNGLYTPLGLPVSGEQKRLSTYGAQEKVKSMHFSDEKVKAMLLALKVMLLAAEVMLLHALIECMEIKFYFSLAAFKLLPILLKIIVSESM